MSLLNSNLDSVFEISIFNNNKLYLDVSTIERTINNKKKVVLKNKLYDDNKWLLFVYNSNNNNINDLYFNF